MCDFSKFKYVFKCEQCGEDFGANSSRAKFCGTLCSYRHRGGTPRPIKEGPFAGFLRCSECAQCGSAFGSNSAQRRFCGRKCSAKALRLENPDRFKAYAVATREKLKGKNYFRDWKRKREAEDPLFLAKNRESSKRWKEEFPEKYKETMRMTNLNRKIKKSSIESIDAMMQIKEIKDGNI